MKDSLQFFVDSPMEGEYFMQHVLGYIVRKGDCVVDVGANHGLHTIPLSKLVGDTGTVIACEAIAENILYIKIKQRADTGANNIVYRRFAVTKPAIANAHKDITFHHIRKRDGYSGILKRPDIKEEWGDTLITVPTATLDQLVAATDIAEGIRISFIKIDVEGGDFDVLLGAEHILLKHKPVVIFENGGNSAARLYGYTKEEFYDYFKKLGYNLFQFTGGRFEEDDWGKSTVYWELWMVHNDSEFLNYFQQDYAPLVKKYTDAKQKGS